jgi:hypothetical protein
MMTEIDYSFKSPVTRNIKFMPHGYGPFLVKRSELVDQIIGQATPLSSVHLSGCRAAGKTTMLQEIGTNLLSRGERVFFFNSSKLLDHRDVYLLITNLIRSGKKAYVLVDETQANHEAALFVDLLKSTEYHQVTTIAAGISTNATTSYQFTHRYQTSDLFLTTDQSLVDEGVVEYFHRGVHDNGIKAQILILLKHIRFYVGGHIYPLLWLAEKLVPKLVPSGPGTDVLTAAQAKTLMESSDFTHAVDIQQMVDRILPSDTTDIRCLFYNKLDADARALLRRKGVCNDVDQVLSYLLLQSIVSKTIPLASVSALTEALKPGLEGVTQLLTFALPCLDWSMYNAFGGPTEDALTHELIVTFYQVASLSAKLFNPKLVDAGTAARRPDMFLNTIVNSFVECVLAAANNNSTVLDIERHMRRFLGDSPRYNIGNRDYAVLIYQDYGQEPISLMYLDDPAQGLQMTAPLRQAMELDYQTRVYTFLMQTGAVYLGNQLVAGAVR